MYSFSDIKTIHLEITTRCNAACPMCARNLKGGAVNPNLKISELRLDDIKTLLPADKIQGLKRIFMCGNFGDPAVAQDTLEVFKYLRESHPTIKLGLHSNGSIRTPSWWNELGKIVDYCHFGIDGLEDTNHIYRRGTHWSKIMENAKAFIEAGHAVAMWDFIIFKHNEHQVELARSLAQDMGFSVFSPKKTGRFYSNKTQEILDHFEVLDKDGNVDYYLEPPTNPDYLNKSFLDHTKIKEKYQTLDAYYEQTHIQCKVSEEKSIYISAEGLIFPCCWTANQMFTYTATADWKRFIENLPEGKESVNGLQKPIESIIDGFVFQNAFPTSWNKHSFQEGRLKVCAKTCGSEMDLFKKQFEK